MFYPTISCSKARLMIRQGAQLVDVRTPQEYACGALPGAVNLPLQWVAGAHEHLDQERPVIVYCRSGQRSEMARMILASIGFSNVWNIGGYGEHQPCLAANS